MQSPLFVWKKSIEHIQKLDRFLAKEFYPIHFRQRYVLVSYESHNKLFLASKYGKKKRI
jgi:hypothetical protein